MFTIDLKQLTNSQNNKLFTCTPTLKLNPECETGVAERTGHIRERLTALGLIGSEVMDTAYRHVTLNNHQ